MIKKSVKKSIITLFFAILSVLSLILPAFADDAAEENADNSSSPVITNAQAAYLYNFENDKVLFEYNSNERVYPTSTVKIMTAIVAMEAFEDALDTQITVTQAMLDEVSGNRIEFSAGEIVTVEQMLNCMLVNSSNDAAIILAHATAGSSSAFVEMMNQKAAWIGAYNTYYTNPTGMHDNGMVTTAKDTATIAKYAYNIPGFIEITSTPKYVMEATNMSDYRSIYNRNCMISKYYNVEYYYSKAIGMNAGATAQGGYAICGVAEKISEDEDRPLTYLAIVLGADEVDGVLYNYENAISMFEWAFASYDYITVLSDKKMICELPVNLSSTLDYVTLVPEENITLYLPTSIDINNDIKYSYNTYEDSIDAPVEAGQEVGTITVLYNGDILSSCRLITTSSITRSEFLYFLSEVKEFSRGRLFRGTVISIVVLSVAYVFINARRREKKLRHSMGRR